MKQGIVSEMETIYEYGRIDVHIMRPVQGHPKLLKGLFESGGKKGPWYFLCLSVFVLGTR